ncbi:hypothetical protein FIBSPDRAFT_887965 [Athelia psychrophila]|uniref:Uncharacterized protein n=1 Tax=Athelia psychrophila TaxID=1759441 RepID=A0A166P5I5_9AGAM|nr:hypothetical protein FIBSPDRAFT_887965 [Fibularhizoctonia sp. CBS 109695]
MLGVGLTLDPTPILVSIPDPGRGSPRGESAEEEDEEAWFIKRRDKQKRVTRERCLTAGHSRPSVDKWALRSLRNRGFRLAVGKEETGTLQSGHVTERYSGSLRVSLWKRGAEFEIESVPDGGPRLAADVAAETGRVVARSAEERPGTAAAAQVGTQDARARRAAEAPPPPQHDAPGGETRTVVLDRTFQQRRYLLVFQSAIGSIASPSQTVDPTDLREMLLSAAGKVLAAPAAAPAAAASPAPAASLAPTSTSTSTSWPAPVLWPGVGAVLDLAAEGAQTVAVPPGAAPGLAGSGRGLHGLVAAAAAEGAQPGGEEFGQLLVLAFQVPLRLSVAATAATLSAPLGLVLARQRPAPPPPPPPRAPQGARPVLPHRLGAVGAVAGVGGARRGARAAAARREVPPDPPQARAGAVRAAAEGAVVLPRATARTGGRGQMRRLDQYSRSVPLLGAPQVPVHEGGAAAPDPQAHGAPGRRGRAPAGAAAALRARAVHPARAARHGRAAVRAAAVPVVGAGALAAGEAARADDGRAAVQARGLERPHPLGARAAAAVPPAETPRPAEPAPAAPIGARVAALRLAPATLTPPTLTRDPAAALYTVRQDHRGARVGPLAQGAARGAAAADP